MNLKNIIQKNSFTIRKAVISDAYEVCELIKKSIDFFHTHHYSIEEIEIWKRGYTVPILEKIISKKLSYIIQIDNIIAGFIKFSAPEIKGFYIKPRFSNKGFGKQLFQYILNVVKSKGYPTVELTSNQWTLDFYKKNGFELIGEEIIHWENHPFIEYRMMKKLIN